MRKVTPQSIQTGYEHARAAKTTVENTWDDILYFVIPRKRDVLDQIVEGEKKPNDVYDDTAIQSNLVLAAGLSGYMTNAAQRWFELRSRNSVLMNNNNVSRFLNDCSEIMYNTLGNSNFYQQIHELYLDLGAIGTAFIYESEDEKDDVRFYTRHPKECYIIEDDREEVNMVYRAFKMTAYKAYTFFGKDKCGKSINKAIEQHDYNKEFCFIQYVCPRFERDVSRTDALNKPFASYWYSEEDKKICKESGFDEFPYFSPRFYKNSTETYGYGPGTSAYSDIRMINQMMEYYIKGAETSIWPPFLVEHDSMVGSLDLRAGAMNYQRNPLSQGQQVQPIDIKMKAQIALDFVNRTENKISRAFFADLFLMLTQNHNMTATEVIERTQEKMLILGPVLGRLQNELLSPIISRTFNILLRRGKLPPVPQELQGKEYDIIYVSPLAKAQRAVQAQDMTTFLTIIGQMAQMAPDVLDLVDTDEVVRKMSKIYSVDPDVIVDEEVVGNIRKQKAQQQQQMAQMMAMQQGADIAQTATKAGENSARAKQIQEQA